MPEIAEVAVLAPALGRRANWRSNRGIEQPAPVSLRNGSHQRRERAAQCTRAPPDNPAEGSCKVRCRHLPWKSRPPSFPSLRRPDRLRRRPEEEQKHARPTGRIARRRSITVLGYARLASHSPRALPLLRQGHAACGESQNYRDPSRLSPYVSRTCRLLLSRFPVRLSALSCFRSGLLLGGLLRAWR